jgi:hypothetical protein
MAVALMVEFPHVTQVQYETARGLIGEALPPGLLLHVAGPTENGWRVLEVWNTPEDVERFFGSETAQHAFQSAGFPPAQPDLFPVHTLVPG